MKRQTVGIMLDRPTDDVEEKKQDRCDPVEQHNGGAVKRKQAPSRALAKRPYRASLPIIPVILSGGIGTGLWPVSRAMYPKQFIQFFDEQETSFLGSALRRLPKEDGFEAPLVMCNNDHRFLVQEELDKASLEASAIVLEPVPRNTAPAIAAAALIADKQHPGATIVVMPSDHLIAEEQGFRDAVRQAARVAEAGHLVLFGIKPREPNPGFGYIRQGELSDEFDCVYSVERFVEKPDRSTAERYLQEGDYFWNSGIFVFNSRTLLDEFAIHAPAVLAAAKAAIETSSDDLGFLRLGQTEFAQAPELSIDYAMMEHTDAVAMMAIDVGWDDVGSWSSLWHNAPHDENDNYTHGDTMLEDTSGSYIHSDKSLVATVGVKDLVIVDTTDVLLVADRHRVQEVSGIVKRLKAERRSEEQQHVRSLRPWGFFESLSVGPRFQVKKLHVKPGAKLSMQMHHHRSEHWIVVQGTAKVVIGDNEQLLRENESVYIIATQWHRLENPGRVPLEIIEVQIGTYVGEDDIVRSDDIYNRAPEETK